MKTPRAEDQKEGIMTQIKDFQGLHSGLSCAMQSHVICYIFLRTISY